MCRRVLSRLIAACCVMVLTVRGHVRGHGRDSGVWPCFRGYAEARTYTTCTSEAEPALRRRRGRGLGLPAPLRRMAPAVHWCSAPRMSSRLTDRRPMVGQARISQVRRNSSQSSQSRVCRQFRCATESTAHYNSSPTAWGDSYNTAKQEAVAGKSIINRMAVRVGFEPTEESPPQRFSRPPDSTTLAPHRLECGSASSIQKGATGRTRKTGPRNAASAAL